MGSIEDIIKRVNLEAKIYDVSTHFKQEKNDYAVSVYELGTNNHDIIQELIRKKPLDTNKPYGVFKNQGYIFVPSGVVIQRKSAKDLGYGILGTARKSVNLIEILETLYGRDFEEVLMHESIHLENWDASEAWVRYETKQRCAFETKFH